MNILFWILQVLLAAHTAMGAFWKFSHSEQTLPTLRTVPHWVWMAMIGVEFLCVLGLLLPAINKSWGMLAPIAAVVIIVEMLYFCAVNFLSGNPYNSQVTYWLVVVAFCAFIAYGRFVLKPI